MTAHARLGPSGAEQWMTCPGSVRLIERLEREGTISRDRGSSFAAEGTAAHELRAICLDLGLDAHDFVGKRFEADGEVFAITDEMANHIQPGIDWIREQPGQAWIEERVRLDHWLPGQFGTLDCGIYDEAGNTIHINDLKYGAGVPVAAERNKQLMIYALGFWNLFCNADSRVRRFVLTIDQPRAGGMKTWEVGLHELIRFGGEVRAAGKAVDSPDAPLVASEKGCRWCPVRNTDADCPAYTGWMREIMGMEFDDLGDGPALADPETITPERRFYIVRHSHLVTAWLAKRHEDSLDAALAGRADPGSKAVAGRKGNRRYTDQEAAEAVLVGALGDAAFERELISPAAAETALKPGKKKAGDPDAWSALNELVSQSDAKPILVPAEDDRPALSALVDLFDDLPETE